MDLKDKKVLLVGLGALGGGLSMAEYLLDQGSQLKVTDLRDEDALQEMVKRLKEISKKKKVKIEYTLGKHQEKDFKEADIIVFNPAVPINGPWVKLAKKLKKTFFNDYTFFSTQINLKPQTLNLKPLIVGITGTRGKTTVSTWANHLIPNSVLGGNIPEANLLKILNKKTNTYVLELSSYQLEYATKETPAPNIAVLTNVYVDHLNRYGTFPKYKKVKFKIFENQTRNDVLVLNADEEVTQEVLNQKPKANLFFVSKKKLQKNQNGMYFWSDQIFYQFDGKMSKVTSASGLAPHEKTNLLTAMLVAHIVGVDGKEIIKKIKNLPNPKLRQEVVFKDKSFTIINDSAGTSPEATIAAIEKFKDKNLVLITGGTNKELEFTKLAAKIKKDVSPENLFLLEGSATQKLIKELNELRYISEVAAYENLEDIVDIVFQSYKKATIVFSPGAASFEKFKNEFDRGEKFNNYVRRYFGRTK